MFAFLGALFAIIFFFTLVAYTAFYIFTAICRAIYNSIERSKYTGSNYSYGDTDYIDNEVSEVIDVDYDQIEEEERMGEAYLCPECGDPYDGIYCENCGHSNDMPGDEELSEADKWFVDMTAIALFNEEDKRREAEREEQLFGGFDFHDEFDDDFDGDFF